jgi:Arc/MetJ family transcription regulator
MSKGAKERKTLVNIALRQQVGNNGAEIPCDRPTIEEAA